MTRGEADMLGTKVTHVEDEVAKLQRVRHDVEVLLSGQMRNLLDRVAQLEGQLASFRESLYENSTKNNELATELAELRGQLEETQFQYRSLENDQKTLAQKQLALKAAQNHVPIPPIKKDHLDLAKKLHAAQKYDQALYLFDEYIKAYEHDKEKESISQALYALGEIYRYQGETNKTPEDTEKLYKKSVISYQKVNDYSPTPALREEALFKLGVLLKTMGNDKAAIAAFNQLLTYNKNSKRALEAKKYLSTLAASENS
jgi:TolA-binding protein